MNPYHHRQLRIRIRRSPHIQRKTVFTRPRIAKHHVIKNARLHTPVTKLLRLAYAIPFRGRRRRLPAQLPHGGRRIRNSQESIHRSFPLPLDDPGLHRGLRRHPPQDRRRHHPHHQHPLRHSSDHWHKHTPAHDRTIIFRGIRWSGYAPSTAQATRRNVMLSNQADCSPTWLARATRFRRWP